MLTGKTRHRPLNRWGRAPSLVLQVEVTYTHTENIGGYIDCEQRTVWRDATVEDMLEVHSMSGSIQRPDIRP